MASTNFRDAIVRTDVKCAHNEEHDYETLDDSALDASSPNRPSSVGMRRGSSFLKTTPTFASDAPWHDFAVNAQSGAVEPNNSSQMFGRPRAQNVPGLSAPHTNLFSQHPSNWQTNGMPEIYSAATGLDNLADFDANPPASFAPASHLTSSGPAFDGLQLSPTDAYQPLSGLPASPQSCKEGWISCSSSDGVDYRGLAQQMRTQSPSLVANTHLLRRDGIRKKNARFEIPAERNLRTIDQLINQTSDEQELKELKQQKRLLRNRQAALDSRQRKKQHTERLEEEKKHYTAVISELEDALNDLKMQEAEWTTTKESWVSQQRQYQQYVDGLILEKEELVRRHTLETGDLRKKNAILSEQLQRMEGVGMSNAPSSTGFSGEFCDFDNLTMNSWDEFPVNNEFSMESEPHAQNNAGTTPKNDVHNLNLGDDKAVASGFLLMLLLCGAWVASRSSTSSSPFLPAIPDDMRAASATVLDNIYKGSGVTLDGVTDGNPIVTPARRSFVVNGPQTALSAFELASFTHTSLESLHQRLTAPTEQQQREQAFSLTPTQYNELAPQNAYPDSNFFGSPDAKNVGQVLGAADTACEGNMGDTYAKSLLKGRVSTQVLKDFARMVAESRPQPSAPWKFEQLG